VAHPTAPSSVDASKTAPRREEAAKERRGSLMAHENIRRRSEPGNMRAMRNGTKTARVLALAMMFTATVTTLASCGSSAPAGDQTMPFIGSWVFASGMLTPTCKAPLPQLPAFALAGLDVTFTKVDSATIRLEAGTAGCTVVFTVSGQAATAKPGQSCMLDLGGVLREQLVGIKSWTLMAAGDHINNTISGAVAVCSADGTGVLVHTTPPDAGVDEGPDATTDATDATDATTTTGASDAIDASADTSIDASADTAVDAGAEASVD
jgi:hypothetical protein